MALARKEVTPPFKPNVESDESTSNFDPEFTSADLRDVGVDYWDEDEAMLVDSQSGQRILNGPAGSERMMSIGSMAPAGAIDVVTPMGSFRPTAPTAVKQVRKRRSSSPISRSLQENFRGFSYTASESVEDLGSGVLSKRLREEEGLERLREARRGDAEAVGDEEIPISASPKQLEGAFGEADEAMKRMNIGARH